MYMFEVKYNDFNGLLRTAIVSAWDIEQAMNKVKAKEFEKFDGNTEHTLFFVSVNKIDNIDYLIP